jgi:hypothetical protein
MRFSTSHIRKLEFNIELIIAVSKLDHGIQNWGILTLLHILMLIDRVVTLTTAQNDGPSKQSLHTCDYCVRYIPEDVEEKYFIVS